MLREYYLPKEDTGERVFVGYAVNNLTSLEGAGYHISRTAEDDFIKARKRGTVYIERSRFDVKEKEAFLYDNKGRMITTAYRYERGW